MNQKKNNSKIIIWDMDNTLFRVKSFGIARSIGIRNFIRYYVLDKQKPRELLKLLFNILNLESTQKDHNQITCSGPKGEPLPDIMTEWLKGKITSSELIDSTNDLIEKLYSEGYFISDDQKKLIKKIVNVIFNPQILAKNFKPIKEATTILKECHDSGYEMIILSNFDHETFDYLYDSPQGQKVFQYFDQDKIIISGNIGFIKPDPKIYEYVLNKFKLKASDCFFIDDQIDNILAAEKLGITGFHIENKNYDKLKKTLNI